MRVSVGIFPGAKKLKPEKEMKVFQYAHKLTVGI